MMSKKVMGDIVKFLSGSKGLILDITGGCPELNPDFKYFAEKAQPYVKKIMVRSNLTILLEPGMEDMAGFYKKHKIHLICSLPCYTEENVTRQRGPGVFNKSIKALRILNDLGYGREKNLALDLVYNPGGAFLPGNQKNLEEDYKKVLGKQYGVAFNRLITVTNAPINRFEQYLKTNGDFDEYMALLMDNFNRDTAGSMMCRNLLNVSWDGRLYDCDFNQALDLTLRDRKGWVMKVESLNPRDLENKDIIFGNHCYCCTAGSGSSCTGALKDGREGHG